MSLDRAPRYVLRFFFDPPTGTCFWAGNRETEDRFDYPIDADTIPLSAPTVQAVQALVTAYEAAADPLDPVQLSWTQQEFDQFCLEVDRVLTVVQEELGPEFTVDRTRFSRSLGR